MNFPTSEEIKARDCLRTGSWLINPMYQFPQDQAIAKFKERCRLCWEMHKHFPQWVKDLIEQWAAEKKRKESRQLGGLTGGGSTGSGSASL